MLIRPMPSSSLTRCPVFGVHFTAHFLYGFSFSNRIEPSLRSFAVDAGRPCRPPWMEESAAGSRTIESVRSLCETKLVDRSESAWAATQGEGIAVIEPDDQEAPESGPRLDLAGRLFRPHASLFQGSRPSSSKPAAIRSRHGDADLVDRAQHPFDVLCGGMYRACSTWQYEVAAHLIERLHGWPATGIPHR